MGGLSLYALVVPAIVWASALIYYDLRFHRLPNLLTVPAALVSVVWALFMQNTGQILWAAVTWPALYIAQLVVSFFCSGWDGCNRGVGGGDIKLAVPLGVAAAAVGNIFAVLLASMTAAILSLCAATLLRRSYVAHGPAMILATVMVSIVFVE